MNPTYERHVRRKRDPRVPARFCAVVVADDNGRIRCASTLAIEWLRKYFPPSDFPEELPAAIRQWLSAKAARHRSLGVTKSADRLFITMIASEPDGPHCLFLEEKCSAKPRWRIGRSRLTPPEAVTPREAEVLSWVAQGKANWEIGKILNLSPGTVRKHLQHIYTKLGVENRTAAALCMFEIAERIAREMI